MDKQKIIILALAIGLIFVLNFFLLDNYFKENQRQIEEAFLSGRDQGIKETITMLFEASDNCNIVPIFIENATKNLVDVECLEIDGFAP